MESNGHGENVVEKLVEVARKAEETGVEERVSIEWSLGDCVEFHTSCSPALVIDDGLSVLGCNVSLVGWVSSARRKR